VNGAIKCQQISGGDGFATMADGSQTFMFSFGPLSGLADIAKGLPGTQVPAAFNTFYPGNLHPGDPDTTGLASFIGSDGARITAPLDLRTTYTPMRTATSARCHRWHVDPRQIMDVGVMNGNIPAPLMAFDEDDEFFLTLSNVGMIMRRTCSSSIRSTFTGIPTLRRSTTACPTPRWPSTSAAASPITI